MTYQVYVEGPRDPSPAGMNALGRVIAERYRMPADDLVKRLQAGRFRVKADIDLDTATRLAQDLESLGAKCTIVDNAGRVVGAPRNPRLATQPPTASLRPATAPIVDEPEVGESREGDSRKAGERRSGLSAARSAGESPAQHDLGMLQSDFSNLSLATLDGQAEESPKVSVGSGGSRTVADDAFRPPEAQQQELVLAVAEVDSTAAVGGAEHWSPGRVAGADMDMDSALGAPAVAAVESPVFAAGAADLADSGSLATESPDENAPAGPSRSIMPREHPIAFIRRHVVESERVRFAAGVVVAVVLGFLPAHIVASALEHRAFDEIDAEVAQAHATVVDLDDWNHLDAIRATLLESKDNKRGNIAIGGILVWLGSGAGLGYLWFRKIDWDRLAAG